MSKESEEVFAMRAHVVRVSTTLATVMFIGSFLFWLLTGAIFVNPFVCLLGLVACSFFFWMSRKL